MYIYPCLLNQFRSARSVLRRLLFPKLVSVEYCLVFKGNTFFICVNIFMYAYTYTQISVCLYTCIPVISLKRLNPLAQCCYYSCRLCDSRGPGKK